MTEARTTLIVCLYFLFLQFSNAQCPTGDVIITNQAQLNTFAATYPSCSAIDGKLVLGDFGGFTGTDITDLMPLANITSTKGLVIYNNPHLDELYGLHNITTVDGDLMIMNNQEIDHLMHLTNITGIVKSISITGNGEIADLYGLENTVLQDGSLSIEGNMSLSSLDGLGSLSSLNTLKVTNNPSLLEIHALSALTKANMVKIVNLPKLESLKGLNALHNVGSLLEITDLEKLTSLSALAQLKSVDDMITLALLPNLSSLTGLEGLKRTYALAIINNQNLADLSALTNLANVNVLQIANNAKLMTLTGLESIISLDHLLIMNNPLLADVDGFDNLYRVQDHIQISQNQSLLDLDGMSELRRIEGVLSIVDNDELVSIDGIELAVITGSDLMITENDKLSACDVANVCLYVYLYPTKSLVENNETGCKTIGEINTSCGLLSLPVELIAFDVTKVESTADITWETTSEYNNQGFEIQRSQDGRHWETITWVDAKGVTQERNTYTYKDAPDFRGLAYYRLVQFDRDGQTKESAIKTLKFGYVDSNLSVFPNPAQDMVTIDYPISDELAKEVEIRLYDLTGQLRKTMRSDRTGLTNLDIQGLPSGYYTIDVNGISTKLVIGAAE